MKISSTRSIFVFRRECKNKKHSKQVQRWLLCYISYTSGCLTYYGHVYRSPNDMFVVTGFAIVCPLVRLFLHVLDDYRTVGEHLVSLVRRFPSGQPLVVWNARGAQKTTSYEIRIHSATRRRANLYRPLNSCYKLIWRLPPPLLLHWYTPKNGIPCQFQK